MSSKPASDTQYIYIKKYCNWQDWYMCILKSCKAQEKHIEILQEVQTTYTMYHNSEGKMVNLNSFKDKKDIIKSCKRQGR